MQAGKGCFYHVCHRATQRVLQRCLVELAQGLQQRRLVRETMLG